MLEEVLLALETSNYDLLAINYRDEYSNYKDPISKENLLHIACRYSNDIKILKFLLNYIAFYEEKNNNGNTPAEVASICGNSNLTEYFLSNGDEIKLDIKKNNYLKLIQNSKITSNIRTIELLSEYELIIYTPPKIKEDEDEDEPEAHPHFESCNSFGDTTILDLSWGSCDTTKLKSPAELTSPLGEDFWYWTR
jgi:ankyrin repeat protein